MKEELIRLNKFLSDAGICSRREADRLVQEEEITVNGQPAVLGMKVMPVWEICVRGKRIEPVDEKVLLVVNKPRGIECTTNPKVKQNIVSYINYPVRIYPVGRLDKDSQGLILMTNRGDLVNKIMRAGNYHEKEYIVEVDKPISGEFLRQMKEGVPILDTVTRKCKVEKTGKKTFRIILTQGLNRQIRRMCEYLHYQVVSLKRVRVMNISLDNLPEGQYRKATKFEWEELGMMIQNSSETTVIRQTRRHT